MDTIYIKVYIFIIIILSAVFHEYAHGWVAYRLGDDTAKRAGRLTLNPLAHIDPFGTLLLPLFLMLVSGIFIGWAKPVPYNPFNLTDKKRGTLKVALAGPATNIGLAVAIGLLIRLAPVIGLSAMFIHFAALAAYINIFLALFNLIPIPPLDGSKIVADLAPAAMRSMAGVGILGLFIALIAAFYILPPIAGLLFYLITGTSLF